MQIRDKQADDDRNARWFARYTHTNSTWHADMITQSRKAPRHKGSRTVLLLRLQIQHQPRVTLTLTSDLLPTGIFVTYFSLVRTWPLTPGPTVDRLIPLPRGPTVPLCIKIGSVVFKISRLQVFQQINQQTTLERCLRWPDGGTRIQQELSCHMKTQQHKLLSQRWTSTCHQITGCSSFTHYWQFLLAHVHQYGTHLHSFIHSFALPIICLSYAD